MNGSMTFEQKAERLWKWALRLVGLLAFAFVLVVKDGDVALGAYVIIGGLIGLPHVLSLRDLLNSKEDAG
jgi:hypothetical protein